MVPYPVIDTKYLWVRYRPKAVSHVKSDLDETLHGGMALYGKPKAKYRGLGQR